MSEDNDDTDEIMEVTDAEYRARIARLEPQLRAASVPFESLGWDDYDNSIELYGVAAEWRMQDDLQRAVAGEGFTTAYVNHRDAWETHYHWVGDFAPAKGWRVSYPHKRTPSGGSIWVEERVPTWPAGWFETGYVEIKSAPTAASPDPDKGQAPQTRIP